ncbi:hypothetical protein [Azospirillum sp. sgz301742]
MPVLAAVAATQARSCPAGLTLFDPMDEVADFGDTAALIEQLDLVIAVDTSVAHLARAGEAGVDSVSLRRMLALAPGARRQPVVPKLCAFSVN